MKRTVATTLTAALPLSALLWLSGTVPLHLALGGVALVVFFVALSGFLALRALGLAINEAVANRRPRNVAHQFERDAVLLGEAALFGGREDRAIGQRQESDPDRSHLRLSSFCFPSRSSAAVSKAWAISEMRMLCRIAVPRSSA